MNVEKVVSCHADGRISAREPTALVSGLSFFARIADQDSDSAASCWQWLAGEVVAMRRTYCMLY